MAPSFVQHFAYRMNDILTKEWFLFTTGHFRKEMSFNVRASDVRLRRLVRAAPIGGRPRVLSRLINESVWFCISVLHCRFVAALLTICITGSRRLIARLTWMIVVMCRCTPTLLHT